MTKKKEDAETPKTEALANIDPMTEVLAEVEEHKDAIVTGNIRVLLCVGNSNDPTYREVTMDRMAREIKARFQ